jgi:thiamine biosynthesis lipoprotein
VLAAARAAVGWSGVEVASDRIAFARPGMKLTLNGIAQGYIADRVAARLADEGLTDILVDTGEMRALGGHPDGGDWPVEFAAGGGGIGLRDRALASSSPLGTVLDPVGKVGHIFDPATGEPARARWRQVSVTAPTAVVADGLSTAFCLMERDAMAATLSAFPAARLVHLV